ncbi:MAG: hypothetical protein KY443_01855 [Actinobacteria bacterium]|nr:hypothetical protein [Actinomycetota bacterium]
MSAARRRTALALVLMATAVGVGGELVRADAPVKQGWWSKWQTDPATTSSTPPTVPPPPTGDDGGLTVANGPQGVEAVAAMYFETEEGADATMYLRAAPRQKEGVAPTTSTSTDVTLPSPSPTQPPDQDTIVLPPGANVWACKALSAWERESNGPWSRVPTWDTEGCAPGTVVAAGTAMFWRLFADMQDIDGNYDIVLVPTGTPPDPPPTPVDATSTATPPKPPESPAQSSFMVNFASPDADTLAADESGDPNEEEAEPEPEPEPDPDDSDGDEFIVAGPLDFPDPDSRFGTRTPVRRSPPTSLAASDGRGRGPFGLPFEFPDNRRERLMAVALLLSMAVAMWWKGGSPTRTPRLIGAAAGRSTPSTPPPPALRGIGRFARERFGRPRRL